MHKPLMLSLALAATAVPFTARAQLELPATSPAAQVHQRVGVTDISVKYSSPGIKGRKIFGELVPLDKPWRTGANASTQITFSRDVTFGDKAVPAGTYAVVAIPGAASWEMILSKEMAAVAGGKQHDPKDEVARITVKPSAIPARERLAFIFSNTTDNDTQLDLEWDTVRVTMPIRVATDDHARANIAALTTGAWRPHNNAARYLLEKGDLDGALKQNDASLAIQATWLNHWTRAQIMEKKGKWADAKKHAATAMELGTKEGDGFWYKDAVAKAIADWKNKK